MRKWGNERIKSRNSSRTAAQKKRIGANKLNIKAPCHTNKRRKSGLMNHSLEKNKKWAKGGGRRLVALNITWQNVLIFMSRPSPEAGIIRNQDGRQLSLLPQSSAPFISIRFPSVKLLAPTSTKEHLHVYLLSKCRKRHLHTGGLSVSPQ